MKAAIISLGSKSSQFVADALKKYFDTVDMLDIRKIEVRLGDKSEVLYEEKPIRHYDCIYAKGSFRYATLLRSLTALLYGKCFMPIKPSAFTVGHNKLLSQIEFQLAGVPSPKSYVTSPKEVKSVLRKVNYPIIMKLPEGTQGKGVMFADSYATASSILDTLASLNQPFVIQEYIETGSTDTRVIVVGDKVVGAMQRKASAEEKRANIHAGGTGESIELDPHTKKIAIKAAQSIGIGICGVDILEGARGPFVIEVNVSPGLQGIMEYTKIDLPAKIAKYLYEETVKRNDATKTEVTSKIYDDLGLNSGNEKNSLYHEVIISSDLRSNRLLIPEKITRASKIDEKDEIIVKVKKGEIHIKKI